MRYPSWLIAGAIVLCLLGLMLGAHSAFSQTPCADTKALIAGILEGGNKLAADMKLETDTGPEPMQIYANPKSGKWVIILNKREGFSCLIAVGEGWSPARLPGSDI